MSNKLEHPRTVEEHIIAYCIQYPETLPPSIMMTNEGFMQYEIAVKDLKEYLSSKASIYRTEFFVQVLFAHAINHSVDWAKVTRKIVKELEKEKKAKGTLWEK